MTLELPLVITLCVAFLVTGIIVGMMLHYYGDHRPLEARYERLVKTLTFMKRQGFVPLFEIEQPEKLDVSKDVIEH